MLTKTKCWFESNHKIVPKLKEKYILKKDFDYEYQDKSQCAFDRGMVCELYSYNSEKGLELKIDLRTMPNWWKDNPHQFIFFHPMNDEIIKKSSLVLSITGTSALQAAFYEKPSIVFAHTIFNEFHPSIRRVKNLEELPSAIRSALKTKVDVMDLNRYIDIIEKESFKYNPHIFDNESNPIFKTIFSFDVASSLHSHFFSFLFREIIKLC